MKIYIVDIKLLGILVLIFTSFFKGFSQNQLVLLRGNKIITQYTEGERIRFKTKANKNYSRGTIIGIHNYHIKINRDSINLSWIKNVDLQGKVKKKSLIFYLGINLIISGAGYLLINQINSKSNSQLKDSKSYAPYGLMVVGGALTFRGYLSRYFKVGRRRKISVLRFK